VAEFVRQSPIALVALGLALLLAELLVFLLVFATLGWTLQLWLAISGLVIAGFAQSPGVREFVRSFVGRGMVNTEI
jgi:hypothetical protein